MSNAQEKTYGRKLFLIEVMNGTFMKYLPYFKSNFQIMIIFEYPTLKFCYDNHLKIVLKSIKVLSVQRKLKYNKQLIVLKSHSLKSISKLIKFNKSENQNFYCKKQIVFFSLSSHHV